MFVCVRERFYSICSHILFLTKFMDKEQKLEKRTKTLFCSFVKIIFRKIVTNTLNSASIRLVWIWKPDLFQDLKWRETSQKKCTQSPPRQHAFIVNMWGCVSWNMPESMQRKQSFIVCMFSDDRMKQRMLECLEQWECCENRLNIHEYGGATNVCHCTFKWAFRVASCYEHNEL